MTGGNKMEALQANTTSKWRQRIFGEKAVYEEDDEYLFLYILFNIFCDFIEKSIKD